MPRTATDWTGFQYSYLRIIGPSEARDSHGRRKWLALCLSCGTVHPVDIRDIRKRQRLNRPVSCGCKKKEFIGAASTTHGLSGHPAWAVWHSMKQRCTDPNHKAWANYGGRGITVCESWLKSFEAFWSDMGATYRPGLELDRRENNAGYSPENCRWVTRRENTQNRRCTLRAGKESVPELAERSGIARSTLYYRISHGVPDDLLLTPPDVRNRFMTSSTAESDTSS